MKTVFILGAGASAAAGAPVMSNFLSRARNLHAEGAFTQHDAQFRDVINAADFDLRDMYVKAHLRIHDNIEELFSAVDMGVLIGRFGRRAPAQIDTLRNSIVTFIFRTIEETVRMSVTDGQVDPMPAYGDFANVIFEEAKRNAGRAQNVSVLTFNYDVCLEYALARVGLGVNYHLNEPFAAEALNKRQVNIPVLKLHGSINWGWCEKCRAIVPTNVDRAERYILVDLPDYTLPLGSELTKYQHRKCGSTLYPLPFIVPPTWDKAGTKVGDLPAVWRQAALELSAADNIVIIGYSFPQTDTFFKYLYALGVNSDKRLNSVRVISLDGAQNFDKLKGAVSGDVFEYFAQPFVQTMHIVRMTLGLQ